MKHNNPWLRKEIEKIFDREALDKQTTDGEAEWIGGILGEIEALLDTQEQELRARLPTNEEYEEAKKLRDYDTIERYDLITEFLGEAS